MGNFVNIPAASPPVGRDEERLQPRAQMQEMHVDHLTVHTGQKAFGTSQVYMMTSETHPELIKEMAAMVERANKRLPARKRIQNPTLFLGVSDIPNAVALTPNSVMLTTGLLDMMTFDETCGIIGHELGHVVKLRSHGFLRGILPIAAYVAGFFSTLRSERFSWKPEDKWYTKGGKLLAAYTVGLLAEFLCRNITVRFTENQSDAIGAEISMRPEALKSALRKIHTGQSKIKTVWNHISGGYPTLPEREHTVESVRKKQDALPHPVTTVSGPLTYENAVSAPEAAGMEQGA